MPVDIIVPPLSQTSDTLILLEWIKKPGEKVEKGEAIFTVETDKASLEVEATESGVLYEIYAQPNSEIKIRSVIGKILRKGEQPQQQVSVSQEKEPPEIQRVKPIKTKEPDALIPKNAKRHFSSPRARRFARQIGVDITKIEPTGPRGLVIEQDVINYKNNTLNGSARTVAQTHIREVIARRMMESHLGSAPVSYIVELDATNMVESREHILNQLPLGAVRPTYTDFFIRILCLALQHHPQFNATVANDQLEIHSEVNLALAVDTDNGLIVPVINTVNQMSLTQISEKRYRLVSRVIEGKISPEELTGGTITITNIGAMGVDFFTPIINPPQVVILGIGRIHKTPAVKDNRVCVRDLVYLSITCDHRFIDGGPAARFLGTLGSIIESDKLLNLIKNDLD